jgi:5-formyltetrahydrofolate cyclo-ligase
VGTSLDPEESKAMQTWQEIRQWRRAQRDTLLQQRIAAGGRQRKQWAAIIDRQLIGLLPDVGGKIIGFYWPFKGEFDARGLMGNWLQQGAQAALPVVLAARTALEFRRWQPGDETEPGVYKIPVPKQRHVVIPDILLVPLVGFDPAGYRLGYGGGYYDRTLAALAVKPMAIGIGFEQARLATIYPQPHDIPMDIIITESGTQSEFCRYSRTDTI